MTYYFDFEMYVLRYFRVVCYRFLIEDINLFFFFF